MALPETRADALVAYLSGADEDGGVQGDPALSLGGFRSSSRAASLGVLIDDPIRGLRVDFASPGNPLGFGGVDGVGVGSLRALSDDVIVWTPPDGDAPAARGPAVTIASGQQRLVEGADPAAYLLVTRTGAEPLVGQSTLTLTRGYNDLFGQSNVADVADAPRTYRLLVLRNAGGGTIRDLRVWIGDCDHPVRLGREDPDSQPAGGYQTIADESQTPGGVTFGAPSSPNHAATITVPRLAAGHQVGIWIERWVIEAS